eukprot:4621675-Pleurochrysis_carterae.AAC.1
MSRYSMLTSSCVGVRHGRTLLRARDERGAQLLAHVHADLLVGLRIIQDREHAVEASGDVGRRDRRLPIAQALEALQLVLYTTLELDELAKADPSRVEDLVSHLGQLGRLARHRVDEVVLELFASVGGGVLGGARLTGCSAYGQQVRHHAVHLFKWHAAVLGPLPDTPPALHLVDL